jgi:hypothetical protein
MRRGQLVSFDLLAGSLLFILFVGVLAMVLFSRTPNSSQTQFEYELVYAFDNLESNLRSDPSADFLVGYRVDQQKLVSFSAKYPDITDMVIGTAASSGIGLGADAYDTCLYFVDTDGSFLSINGASAAGKLKSNTCDAQLKSGQSLCQGYSHAMAVFRPVLLDTGSRGSNRIIQMNVVACRL